MSAEDDDKTLSQDDYVKQIQRETSERASDAKLTGDISRFRQNKEIGRNLRQYQRGGINR